MPGLGGTTLWINDQEQVRVPDRVRNGVIYLAGRRTAGDPDTEVKVGSGFLISISRGSYLFTYIVTADHVVRDLDCFPEQFGRLNDSAGNGHTLWVPIRGDREKHDPWQRHPDPSVDLAVREFVMPYVDSILDGQPIRVSGPRLPNGITTVPDHMIIKDEQFSEDGIGIGDEIFVAGLFRFMAGQHANEPILRVGNLAMIPRERIAVVAPYNYMEGYLIESRSIAGLSGSPVFVRETVRTTPKKSKVHRYVSGRFFLLGIVHGLWHVRPEDLYSTEPEVAENPDKGLNVGVSAVVPAKKLRDILHGPVFSQQRDEHMAAVKNRNKKNTPTPSSIRPDHVEFNPAVAAIFQVPKAALKKARAKPAKRARKKT